MKIIQNLFKLQVSIEEKLHSTMNLFKSLSVLVGLVIMSVMVNLVLSDANGAGKRRRESDFMPEEDAE